MIFDIGKNLLDLDIIGQALAGPITVSLSSEARASITRSAETVERLLKSGDALYGINTGFGKLAKTRIATPDQYCALACGRRGCATARRCCAPHHASEIALAGAGGFGNFDCNG
jgi:hypothetical protein